jgi:hypothetical protein
MEQDKNVLVAVKAPPQKKNNDWDQCLYNTHSVQLSDISSIRHPVQSLFQPDDHQCCTC